MKKQATPLNPPAQRGGRPEQKPINATQMRLYTKALDEACTRANRALGRLETGPSEKDYLVNALKAGKLKLAPQAEIKKALLGLFADGAGITKEDGIRTEKYRAEVTDIFTKSSVKTVVSEYMKLLKILDEARVSGLTEVQTKKVKCEKLIRTGATADEIEAVIAEIERFARDEE